MFSWRKIGIKNIPVPFIPFPLFHSLTETSGEAATGQVTHQYEYDLAGNRTRTQYGARSGSGRLLVSAYDALNRLQTLTVGSGVTGYQYDLGGHVRVKLLADGEVETTHYDALGRQSDSSDQGAGGLLYAYSFGHDLVGNLTSQGEYKVGLAARFVVMGYDAVDRLTGESVFLGSDAHAPPGTATTYGYDEMGDRISRAVSGGLSTTYAYNPAGQLQSWSNAGASASYTYDANGNRLTCTQGGNTASYGYDPENRLTSLSQGGVAYAYLYDYRTRRVERTEGGSATGVVFSGGTSVQEYTGNGTASAPSVEFIRGSDWGGGVGGILYSLRGGNTSFDHYDGRGDVATQTSGSGSITYQGEYEAWGTRTAEWGSDQDRQRANTKEEDPTGLLNENQRYRDLATGVFITRDPLGFVDGPNVYAYVNDNPWTKFDPEGLSAIEAAAKVAEDELSVGGRSVIHAEWAGKTIKPSELPKSIPGREELAKKYPEGVRYTEKGRPDFTPYVREGSTVPFEEGVLTGEMSHDAPLARSALQQKGITDAQIAEMEKGYTWHHVEGGQAMELVPSDLHDAYRHTGGRADIKAGNWFTRGVGALFTGIFANTIDAHQNGGSVAGGLVKDGIGMTDAGLVAAPAELGAAAGHAENQQVERARSKRAEDTVRQYHSGIPELDRMNAENLRGIQAN